PLPRTPFSPPSYASRLPNREEPFHQRRQLVERHHVGPVARGFFRPGMGLKKHGVYADRNRRLGERLDHLALATRRSTESTGLLHAMRRVVNDRHAEGLHFRDRPKVVYQPA